ncbi:hypothetical protein HK107_15480, partial [Parvularcula sp. ZS-1/3]
MDRYGDGFRVFAGDSESVSEAGDALDRLKPSGLGSGQERKKKGKGAFTASASVTALLATKAFAAQEGGRVVSFVDESEMVGIESFDLREDGLLEVRHEDGRLTLFDDSAFEIGEDGALFVAQPAAESAALLAGTTPREDALYVEGPNAEEMSEEAPAFATEGASTFSWTPFLIAAGFAGLAIIVGLATGDDDDEEDGDGGMMPPPPPPSPANNAPEFTSDAAVSVAEGGTVAVTAEATDADGDGLTYSISGTDAALFSIDAASGELTFNGRTDFEAPADDGGDNVYDLTVSVTDGEDTTEQAVTITVTDAASFTVDGTDGDDALDLSGQDEDITVNAGDGADSVATDEGADSLNLGGGADVAFAGQGADSVSGGEGDDVVVAVGTTGADEYAESDITDAGGQGVDISGVLTLDRLNGQATSDVVSGEVIDGGEGMDSLVTYGDIDLSQADLISIERLILNSDVTASAEDFGDGGVEEVVGDGTAILRLVGTGTIDLAELDLSGVTFIDLGENVTLSAANAQALADAGITAIGGAGSVAFGAVAGTELAGLVFGSGLGVSSNGADIDPEDFGGTTTEGAIGGVVLSGRSSVSVAENGTAVETFSALSADGEDVVFSVSGTDAGLFVVDPATGVLTFADAPDFEAPGDDGGDNVYNLTVTATAGETSVSQDIVVTVTGLNDNAPVFTSATGVSVAENTTDTGYQAIASDADGDDVSYSITGGADGDLFSVDANGFLTFNAAPDFEAPGDADSNNAYLVEVTASDGTNSSAQLLTVTVTDVVEGGPDLTAPKVQSSPTGTLTTAPTSIRIGFDEPVGPSAAVRSAYQVFDGEDNPVEISSIVRVNASTIRLNLPAALEDGEYTVRIADSVEDLAGNNLATDTSFDFTVAAPTRIVAVRPTDGDDLVNLESKVTVEFDRPIDPDTVSMDTVKVMANGVQQQGQLFVSPNKQIITFVPDQLMPSGTKIRVMVDGDEVMGANGSNVDADGDGASGGMLQSEFSTVTLTRVENTNIEGFIFDSNNRAPDGSDLPLEGVIVSVVGLPGVTTTTDENGRFFLEDLPVPDAYLHFDATPVTAETGFSYGTIVKPVHTIAGQTVGMTTPDGTPFNIYFAAFPETDATPIAEDGATEAGLGDFGKAQLAEILPDVDPAEFEKLKVVIPEGSLIDDEGNPAESVTVLAFSPDRIPAPTPPGFDPDYVFTVSAGEAINVSGKAQIELPNLNGDAPGTQLPIMSFDHDAGEWVQTGTGIVSDDGETIISEGDTGVNTLGWKFVGDQPTSPATGPEEPENEDAPEDEPPCEDEVGLTDLDTITSIAKQVLSLAADLSPAGTAKTLFRAGELIAELTKIALDGAKALRDLQKAIDSGESAEVVLRSFSVIKDQFKDIYANLYNAAKDFLEKNSVFSAACTLVELSGTLKSICDSVEESECQELGFWAGLGCDAADLGNRVGSKVKQLFELASGKLEANGLKAFCFAFDAFEDILKDSYDLSQLNVDDLAIKGPTLSILNESGVPSDDVRDALSSDIDQLLSDLSVLNEPLPDLASELEEIEAAAIEAGESVTEIVSAVGDISAAVYEYEPGTYYAISYDGIVRRGLLSESGIRIDGFPPDTPYVIEFYDHERGLYGVSEGTSNLAGLETVLASPMYERVKNFVDTDGDGIIDIAEGIIGTNADDADTDGDGIKDGAELDQGLNPLDGLGFPTGLISQVALQGEALDVEVIGSVEDTSQQTAYVATGSHGLAVIDASDFQAPILLGEIDLPGTNVQATADDARGLAFVAAGSVGLHIVDVSDPLEPTLVRTVTEAGSVNAVISLNGLVIAAGDNLSVIGAVTGEVFGEVDVAGEISSIAFDGENLFAVVDNQRLVSYDFDGEVFTEIDSISIPTPPVRRQPFEDFQVFVSDGVAFVSNGIATSQIAGTRPLERGGLITFDVSDASDLQLISNIDTGNAAAGNLETVVNGSGLAAVAAGQFGLQVLDVSDPGETFDVVTTFDTDGRAEGVALAGGLAFVADGSGGLKVINFIPFDTAGEAPTISIDSDVIDADPDTDGLQVEEGTRLNLDADISDDVQVRSVELIVNGEVVSNDLSAPFDLFFNIPSLASGAETVTVQVRATDTGGNSSLSEELTFDIIEDITPPEIVRVTPVDGSLALTGQSVVQVLFSEPVDPDTVDIGDLTLTEAGAPDTVLEADDIILSAEGRIARYVFLDLPVGEYTVDADLSGATDFAGNAIGGDALTQSFEVADATAVFSNSAGGSWFTASNWQSGTLPTEDDGVLIVVDDGASVQFNSFTFNPVEVDRIRLGGTLELDFGSLDANEIDASDGQFVQDGGVLLNTTITASDDATGDRADFRGFGTIDNVVIDAQARVTGNVTAQTALRIDDVLAVGGDGTSGSESLNIRADIGTVAGSGTLQLDEGGFVTALSTLNIAETLVFNEDLTIRGFGTLGTNGFGDRVQIDGQVIAEGGTLRINNINNNGEALDFTEGVDGEIILGGFVEDVVLSPVAGTSVEVTSATIRDVTIGGAGSVDFSSGNAAGIDINEGAEGRLTNGRDLTVEGLVVDGEFVVAGSNSTSVLGLRGTQELSGSGRVLLSGENAVGGVARNVLQLTSTSNAREELTIGSDIVVEGWGSVSANGNDDTIRFEGLAKGSSEGPLTLFDIDNTQGDGSAGALRVDSSEGVVAVGQSARIIGADFVGEAGTDGILEFFASAVLEEVSLSMDSLLDGTTQSRTVFVQEGLALDGSLEIRGTQSRTTEFRFQGEQEISGTGEIVLTDGGVGDADPLSYLAIQGVTGASEILTIGEDITVRGEGWIFSRSTNDLFAIDGRVVAEGGRLRIEDTASVNGEVGALAGGLLEMRQADLLTEQSKLVIGLDGAGDDAAAGLVTIRQAITLEGILKLEVGDGFAAELGDSFVIAREDFNVTNGEAFAGAFDGFEGFDLEGDLAFRLVRSTDPENSSIQTLVLEVVEDATAEAGGFIGAGSVFTPPDLPAEGTRVEITLDEIGGRVADSEITGTTTDGLSRVEVTNTLAVLENVALGVDLGVDAANGTRRVDIEQGLTFANGAQIILEDSENGVAEARFFGTQTVDGEGGIFMSRVNANVLGIESEIEFVNTLSGARELLTFGEDVTISGDGRVFANGFEDRIRILGEVVGTPENLLEIEDLDNGGATLMVDASAGRVAVDDVVENTRFEGTGELELFDGSYRNVSFGMDARFGGVASGGQTLTVEEGLEVDSLLTVEAPTGGTRFLTALGEQSLVGTGEIVLSGDETSEGQAQNYLDFNGTLVRAETLVIGPDLTVRGEGHIRAIDADDLVDIQGTLIVEGLFEVEDLADFGGTLEIARTGTLEVEDRFNELRELTLTGDAQVTIALGGSGLDARAGQIVIFGEAALAGTLTLDVEAGFTGEIGDEFVIASARDGFASVFDAIEGFDIDGDDKALALVQDDTTLSVRIVSQDEAGSFFLRSQLPPDPVLPELSGTFTGVIDDALAGGPLAQVDDSGATFNSVDLQTDVLIQTDDDGFFRQGFLQVSDGLTLTGADITLESTPSDRAYLLFNGPQTVSGTGEIVLSETNGTPFRPVTNWVGFSGSDFNAPETLTFDVVVRGAGSIFTNSAQDRFQFLDEVIAEGGRLTISYINNGGETLVVSEQLGGELIIQSAIEDTVLSPTAGTVVEIASATIRDLEVAGEGAVDIRSSSAEGILVTGNAILTNGRDLTVEGLVVDGEFVVAGSNSTSVLGLRGTQELSGSGRVLLSGENAVGGVARNVLQLTSTSNAREELTIGSDIVVEGWGSVSANGNDDTIRFEGLAKGSSEGPLTLFDIDNTQGDGSAGALRVDSSEGVVAVGQSARIIGADFVGEAGTDGILEFFASAVLEEVSLSMDSLLDGTTQSRTVFVQEGLALDGSLEIRGTQSRTTEFRFQGEQEISGTGEIVLTDGGVGDADPLSYLAIQGVTGASEILTIGEDITVRGEGWIFSRSTNDLFAIDGRVVAEGGRLRIEDTASVNGEVGALAGGLLEMRQADLLTEQSKLVIGLDGAGDDAAAGLVTIRQAITLEGILKLEVGDGFAAELGDSFVIAREDFNVTNGEAFAGAFDGFEGFDLEGDLAFRLVRSTDPENSSIQTLVLEVVEDATAEAGGFIGAGSVFTPPDLPAEGTRVEITLDEIGGRVADSEITGTTTDGLSRVEVTNTLAVLENVALGVDLGVDAANGTRRVDIEQGLTFANGAQIILEDSENGVAEARFFGTQTVDGEGGIFMSRVNANVLGIESEIEFVNTLSGARELLTFGEDVTISGDGRVFANGFEDRIRILGEVVGTPENLLEIEDLDNGGATLMVDASAGRVAVDDVVENTRFEGTGELELFDGSYRNVSFGMDARFGGVASGGQTLTVEEGLEVDSLLTVEAPTGGTRFLTALGEQSLVGTGEIVLSGDETSEGQAQNYLDFNGTLVRAETLVIGPDLTVRGEGHIRAIDADDL